MPRHRPRHGHGAAAPLARSIRLPMGGAEHLGKAPDEAQAPAGRSVTARAFSISHEAVLASRGR
eukprot:9493606-Pyramimonas_sp.AAC.1